MSPRNKFILLGALVALLGIVAYFQLTRTNEPARNARASPPPAPSAPVPASAPAGAAEAKPADPPPASGSGPSAADLRELAGWFDVLRPTGTVIARGNSPVFGISLKPALPTPRAPSQEPAQISQIPWMTEPGKLDGILKVGNRPGQALFQGELYQVGEKIRGTNFTLTAVGDDFVTLKCDDRVIRRFWHE